MNVCLLVLFGFELGRETENQVAQLSCEGFERSETGGTRLRRRGLSNWPSSSV